MNLSHNLKKIRKEHNLSQEQLAEKLGVSRQSVSKWESNQAYPEMDKVLQLCKMFNLNIDDLLNQDINEVNNSKKAKNNINKFIDDFLNYINKTINVFSALKVKDRLKCIFEQFIISLSIFVVLLIIGTFGSNIVSNLLSFLPDKIYFPVYNIFESLYIIVSLIIGVILLLYIFKTRYLDYYDVVKEEVDDKNIEIEVKEKNVKEPKIIIRDPKHSGYKFISSLVKCLLFILKFIYGCVGILFCVSLVMFAIALILSFIVIETGMFFIGLLLVLISCITINILILIQIYNVIVSRRNKYNQMAVIVIISLVVIGIGLGCMTLGMLNFDMVDSFDSNYFTSLENEYEMNDGLFFDSHVNYIQYVESDNENVKVVYTYPSIYNLEFTKVANGYFITNSSSDYNELEKIRKIISSFNDKKIVDYSDFKITIYTSKENIDILQSNLHEYYNRNIYR